MDDNFACNHEILMLSRKDKYFCLYPPTAHSFRSLTLILDYNQTLEYLECPSVIFITKGFNRTTLVRRQPDNTETIKD